MNEGAIELPIRKGTLLRWHIGIVTAIHVGNIVALWLRYVAVDFRGRVCDTIASFLSVSAEGKLGTFFSGVALLACALLLGIIAYAKSRERERHRTLWALLSLIFLYIAFDEMIQVHEVFGPPLGTALGAKGLLRGWAVPGMIATALVGLAYLRFLIDLPRRSRFLFVVAGAVYVFGALGMELVGNWYTTDRPQDLSYGIIATIEEIFEMGGIVVFVYALLDHLERTLSQGVHVSFR